jgi:hypothetical protein
MIELIRVRSFVAALFSLSAMTGVAQVSSSASPNQVESPAGLPEIRFETNIFDFGKVTGRERVSGVFRFRNTGTAVLRIDPPETSCECTVPELKTNTIAPGETGELSYIIALDRPLKGQRLIRVHSNDPKNPNINLTVQLDYTPLYELEPKTLWITVPPGKEEAQATFTVSRTDGRPVDIDRLTTSQPWISAAVDTGFKSEDNSARVKVNVRRPSSPPSPFSASVTLWRTNESASPAQSIPLNGEILGEFAAVPARLYWVIPDFGAEKTNYPAESLTRTVALKSVLGHEVAVNKVSSSINGLALKVVPKQPGRNYDLILRFDELPQNFSNGKITVETSLTNLPTIEIPLTVAVPNPK